MTTWTSNLSAFNRDNARAEQAGLKAAAYMLQAAVKRSLRGGYTSGDFVTGASVNAVTLGPITPDAAGWAIRVGTNLMYNLFWEIGHHSVFTGKYERVEKWRPAFMDTRDEMRAAYARAWKKEMAKWSAN